MWPAFLIFGPSWFLPPLLLYPGDGPGLWSRAEARNSTKTNFKHVKSTNIDFLFSGFNLNYSEK